MPTTSAFRDAPSGVPRLGVFQPEPAEVAAFVERLGGQAAEFAGALAALS